MKTFAVLCLAVAIVPLGESVAQPPAPTQSKAAADNPPGLGSTLSRKEIDRDLDEFQRIITDEWLLSNSTTADYPAAIAALRRKGEMTTAEFALELQKILALSADGHAGVGSRLPAFMQISNCLAPFAIEEVGDRFVALDPTTFRRNQLWKPDFPYVVAIDDVPIERWVKAAMPYFPQSHPLSMRATACNHLRYVGYFRTLLGIESTPTFTVTLESPDSQHKAVVCDGSDHSRMSLFKYNLFLGSIKRAKEKSTVGDWAILDNNIGYLWIPHPSGEGTKEILATMPKFRNTKGLILDLRRNEGGGGNECLTALGTWITDPKNPRHNAGIERRRKGDAIAENSPVYDGQSPEVTPDCRQFLAQALGKLKGEWSPPARIATSDRCVLLASPSTEPQINLYKYPQFHEITPKEAIYVYSQPVMILVDRHCFSAAEILVAGLQGLPQVTVIGERTKGGAASVKEFQLPASKQVIRVAARSVCLTPTGKLIDGAGVIPDIAMDLDLATITGPKDGMLERAISEIESARKPVKPKRQ